MMNCKEATIASIRKTEGKISFKERIYLAFHLLMCKYCKFFVQQQELLNAYLTGASINEAKLSDEERSSMKSSIQGETP